MSRLLSIIVPCYNEAEVISTSIARLQAVADKMAPDVDTEILLVNDGSSDATRQIITAALQSDPRLRLVSFSRNFGHQAAVTAGINRCRGQMALILDADMQDPPELIPDIVATMDAEQADVVYCVRRERQGESWFKLKTAKLFYRLINRLSDVSLPLDAGDFRLLGPRVISEFNRLPERNKYVRGLTAWVGFRQVPFLYTRHPRLAGETKYPLRKMLRLSLSSLVYFSTTPLKIAVGVGCVATLIGLVLLIWAILGKLMGFTHAELGWTSIFAAVTFFGGMQLVATGVVGLYVGSIFEEVKRRPEYVVESDSQDSRD